MQEVYYTDEVYRDDGIRDPFRWARFSNPGFIGVGFLLVLTMLFASSRDPGPSVAGQGLEVGAHVAAEAIRTARVAR
ncbi:MAG: hypothetical protein ACJAYU_003984 [Bradymonadia bacterium]|jgi:hypothetical protein